MATKSTITAKLPNQLYASVYCGSAGYLSHVGMYLLKYYNTQELVEKLVLQGNLHVLYESADKPLGTHNRDVRDEWYCIYYGRDLNFQGHTTTYGTSKESAINQNFGKQEYNYFWDGENWFIEDDLLSEKLVFNILRDC
jgi:hypothetical protein